MTLQEITQLVAFNRWANAIELSGAVLCAASAPARGEPAGPPRPKMT